MSARQLFAVGLRYKIERAATQAGEIDLATELKARPGEVIHLTLWVLPRHRGDCVTFKGIVINTEGTFFLNCMTEGTGDDVRIMGCVFGSGKGLEIFEIEPS